MMAWAMSAMREVPTCTIRSFTEQTQDVIAGPTGIYDFLFRQQSAGQGRWLVPDPAGMAAVDPTNPQTWNRYAYVANNPLNMTDPLGLDPMCSTCGQSFLAWSQFAQQQSSSHASGVPGPGGSYTSWNGGLGFVTVQPVSNSANLMGYQWVPPNESTDTIGHWELSPSGGGGSLGLWSGTTELVDNISSGGSVVSIPSSSPTKLQQLMNWSSQVSAKFVRWNQQSYWAGLLGCLLAPDASNEIYGYAAQLQGQPGRPADNSNGGGGPGAIFMNTQTSQRNGGFSLSNPPTGAAVANGMALGVDYGTSAVGCGAVVKP